MRVTKLEIPEVMLLQPSKSQDERGFLSETYSVKALTAAGINLNFIQENHSFSLAAGTLRGLHFQKPPMAQDKLVRCVRGSIWDVAVDIRRGSPTYGKHVSAVISAENWMQILIPKGFAHGFLTLEPKTEVIYKVSQLYSREFDAAISWCDPFLGIDWGRNAEEIILSAKDVSAPLLGDTETGFEYG